MAVVVTLTADMEAGDTEEYQLVKSQMETAGWSIITEDAAQFTCAMQKVETPVQ